MTKDYVWFGIKVNILLFIITIIMAVLSGILLIPIAVVLTAVQSAMTALIIGTIWLSALTIIPYFLAFRSVYKKSHLKLYEAIFFALGIKIIIDVILTYFTEEYIDPTMTLINILISSAITFVVFYFAGARYRSNE